MRTEDKSEIRQIACDTCGLIQLLGEVPQRAVARCARCRSVIFHDKPNSLSRTAALSLAALILYVPANVYPVMRMEYMGASQTNTIWTGVVSLARDGMWEIAFLVFCASIMVPLLKLLGLFYLVLTVRSGRRKRDRTIVYKIIESIGRWSMLDVFLLSILVALVKLGSLATVLPGPGIIAFAAVVVLTILASQSFDPRIIWDAPEEENE